MILALGMFVFSVPTLLHEQLQRRAQWRFAQNPRIGARDAVQFVGPGDKLINLSGTAMAELQDGRASLEDLASMADTGQAWPLVDAAGIIFGDFIITGLDEGMRDIRPDGTPSRIEFSIDLQLVESEAG